MNLSKFSLLLFLTVIIIGNTKAQTLRTWVGAGIGAGNSNLALATNWSGGSGTPGTDDSLVINLGTMTGNFSLSILGPTSSLSIKALTINLTGLASAIAVTKVNIDINKPLTISGSLTINNTSLSPYEDSVNFNIGSQPAGTVTCGSLTVGAGQNGAIAIQNNTTFTVNGAAGFVNTGSMSIRFITGNGATTTLNGKTVIGTRFQGQWLSNLNNKILIGCTTNTAAGIFVINGDSLILGFNMGTEKFNAGTILFDGTTKQVVSSYAKSAPDRVPGNLKIGGGTNLSQVYYEKAAGDENDALVVRKALIISDNCLFSIKAVVVPSTGTAVSPDGLIQVNAGATLVLGTKAGTSSTLPDTYKTYNFNPTSTIIFNGESDQTVYEGADYGNVTIGGTAGTIRTAGGDLKIVGNLWIKSGLTFVASDSVNKTINVKGGWTKYGTFIPKTSTVLFDSSTSINISGSSVTNFYNLRINKSGSGSVTMGSGVTVNDTLNITAGTLALSGNTLTLNGIVTGTGTLTGSSTSSLYIAGTGALGILNFTSGARSLGTLNVNRSSGSVALGTDLSVETTVNLADGAFEVNGNTLTLNGTVTHSGGSLSGSNTSNLILSGAGVKNLYFTPGNHTFHDVTVNSSALNVNLDNSLYITGGLGSGTLIVDGELNTNNYLTLKSGLLGTARVGTSSGIINGEVTVERYFQALSAWRFVAVPFSSSSQTINEAWQEGNVDVTLSCPPQDQGTPGYGTAISYKSDAANGFDANNTGNASLKVYSNNMWVVPTSTLTTNIASPNKAYCLFVRGDRSVCLTYVAPPTATTLRPRGVLNQFAGAAIARNFNSGNPGDYVLVGNPYASSVDIRNIISNGIGIDKNKFLVWNPHLGGSFGVGGYLTFNVSTGIHVPNNGTYTAGTVIQNGQAFMVQLSSSSTSGSVTFNEGNKSASETPSVFGLQAAKRKPAAIYVNLLDTSKVLMDGVGAAFGKNYSAAVDSIDASKKWNENIENMALIRNEKPLAIEFRPAPIEKDTLFLRLYLRQHSYLLQIFSQNLPPNLLAQAWIVDKYLNTQTEINLYDTTLYSFSPNTDTNSYRNRFMVVYSRAEAAIAKTGVGTQAATNTGIIEQTTGIYPNPVAGNSFNLVLSGLKKDKYVVNIYSNTGSLISTRNVNHQNSNSTYNLKLPSNTITGNYTVQILSRREEVISSIPLIINK